jgi:hypothetical protein
MQCMYTCMLCFSGYTIARFLRPPICTSILRAFLYSTLCYHTNSAESTLSRIDVAKIAEKQNENIKVFLWHFRWRKNETEVGATVSKLSLLRRCACGKSADACPDVRPPSLSNVSTDPCEQRVATIDPKRKELFCVTITKGKDWQKKGQNKWTDRKQRLADTNYENFNGLHNWGQCYT